MTSQEYLQWLLNSQNIGETELALMRQLRDRIETRLRTLQGSPRFYYAGSYGKNTIIKARYDLDIVVYWPNDVNYTIEGIYTAVGEQLRSEFRFVNSKTVCWEVPFDNGFHLDVVPGRAIDTSFREANLYRTDTGTTLKTSIKTHIDTVRSSGRRDAIRLLKLWRERRQVPFKKSFLLELLTIQGTNGARFDDLPAQVASALTYIRDNIETRQVLDPANSNNSLSDDISSGDKTRIRLAAQAALSASSWSEVFQ